MIEPKNLSIIDFSSSLKLEKTSLLKALRSGDREKAQGILDSMGDQPLNPAESWQLKVFKNLEFDSEEFMALDPKIRNLVYRTANALNNLEFVRRLNSLGMVIPEHLQKPYALGIISDYMDAAQIHQTIYDLLIKLRRENRLLTHEECLASHSGNEWCEKGEFSRLLGADYLNSLIGELGLKHIKVPEKKAVIKKEAGDLLRFYEQRKPYNKIVTVDSSDVLIIAKKISPCNRLVSREEMFELLTLIKVANLVDVCRANFIVAEDGIYCIDTERKSFDNPLQLSKLDRLLCFLSPEDNQFFKSLIEEKMKDTKLNKVLSSRLIEGSVDGTRQILRWKKIKKKAFDILHGIKPADPNDKGVNRKVKKLKKKYPEGVPDSYKSNYSLDETERYHQELYNFHKLSKQDDWHPRKYVFAKDAIL